MSHHISNHWATTSATNEPLHLKILIISVAVGLLAGRSNGQITFGGEEEEVAPAPKENTCTTPNQKVTSQRMHWNESTEDISLKLWHWSYSTEDKALKV